MRIEGSHGQLYQLLRSQLNQVTNTSNSSNQSSPAAKVKEDQWSKFDQLSLSERYKNFRQLQTYYKSLLQAFQNNDQSQASDTLKKLDSLIKNIFGEAANNANNAVSSDGFRTQPRPGSSSNAVAGPEHPTITGSDDSEDQAAQTGDRTYLRDLGSMSDIGSYLRDNLGLPGEVLSETNGQFTYRHATYKDSPLAGKSVDMIFTSAQDSADGVAQLSIRDNESGMIYEGYNTGSGWYFYDENGDFFAEVRAQYNENGVQTLPWGDGQSAILHDVSISADSLTNNYDYLIGGSAEMNEDHALYNAWIEFTDGAPEMDGQIIEHPNHNNGIDPGVSGPGGGNPGISGPGGGGWNPGISGPGGGGWNPGISGPGGGGWNPGISGPGGGGWNPGISGPGGGGWNPGISGPGGGGWNPGISGPGGGGWNPGISGPGGGGWNPGISGPGGVTPPTPGQPGDQIYLRDLGSMSDIGSYLRDNLGLPGEVLSETNGQFTYRHATYKDSPLAGKSVDMIFTSAQDSADGVAQLSIRDNESGMIYEGYNTGNGWYFYDENGSFFAEVRAQYNENGVQTLPWGDGQSAILHDVSISADSLTNNYDYLIGGSAEMNEDHALYNAWIEFTDGAPEMDGQIVQHPNHNNGIDPGISGPGGGDWNPGISGPGGGGWNPGISGPGGGGWNPGISGPGGGGWNPGISGPGGGGWNPGISGPGGGGWNPGISGPGGGGWNPGISGPGGVTPPTPGQPGDQIYLRDLGSMSDIGAYLRDNLGLPGEVLSETNGQFTYRHATYKDSPLAGKSVDMMFTSAQDSADGVAQLSIRDNESGMIYEGYNTGNGWYFYDENGSFFAEVRAQYNENGVHTLPWGDGQSAILHDVSISADSLTNNYDYLIGGSAEMNEDHALYNAWIEFTDGAPEMDGQIIEHPNHNNGIDPGISGPGGGEIPGISGPGGGEIPGISGPGGGEIPGVSGPGGGETPGISGPGGGWNPGISGPGLM